MNSLVIQEVIDIDAELLSKVQCLRKQAWAADLHSNTSTQSWVDDFDSTARHWIATKGDQIVAAARLTVHDTIREVPSPEVFEGLNWNSLTGPIGSINRLVVHFAFRRQGLSNRLDNLRVAAAKNIGCTCIIASSSSSSSSKRIERLREMGFVSYGDGSPYQHPSPFVGRTPQILRLDF